MEKQNKPAPDAPLLALRSARASLLLASLRQSCAPPPTGRPSPSSSHATVDCSALQSNGLLRSEVAAARREAVRHARIAGYELLLVLAMVPIVLLLFLLLGLVTEAP